MNATAENAHTPGEWRAMRGDDLVFVERPNIAHVGVTGGKAYEAPFVIVGTPGPKGSEEADARLIAAAPNLLKSLERLLLEFDFLIEGGDIPDIRNDIIFVAAREAISKATGAAK